MQRAWRATHPLTPEQRRKDNARSFVAVAIKRGKLFRAPCQVCGETVAEAHHFLGYDKGHELDVIWLCREHHRRAHQSAAADSQGRTRISLASGAV